MALGTLQLIQTAMVCLTLPFLYMIVNALYLVADEDQMGEDFVSCRQQNTLNYWISRPVWFSFQFSQNLPKSCE